MKKIFTLVVVALMATTAFAQDNYRVRIHKKDKTVAGYMLSDVDHINFAPKAVAPKETLTIKLGDNDPDHATYQIVPSSDELNYYQFMVSEESYGIIKDQYGTLTDHDQAWWSNLASGNEGVTWQDVMRQSVSKGTQSFDSNDLIKPLMPNTRYCIYAYGIDPETAKVLTDVTELWFTTPGVEMSKNELDIKSVTSGPDGLTVEMTATNDDPYVVTYQTYESFKKKVTDEGSEEAAVDKMISVQTKYGGYGSMVHTGSQKVLIPNLKDQTEYIVLAFGYKYGVRTTKYYRYITTYYAD